MKSSFMKVLSLFLAAIFLFSLIAGCGSTQKSSQSQTAQSGTAPTAKPAETQKTGGPEPVTLPIVKQKTTLTIFSAMNPKTGATKKTYEEVTMFQELEKRTGIDIEWKHPPIGQENEQFNLMLASQDLSDMVWWSWLNVMGGPEKAIQDGAIIKLNDTIAKYAPSLSKILGKNAEARKVAMTDDGNIYIFPLIFGGMDTGEYPASFLGPQFRKDWLDKLGLKPPTTIDEWYKVLKAFKEKDPNGNGEPDEVPFSSSKAVGIMRLATAWGILDDFYMDKGTVKYGPIDPRFKDFLTTMAKWYAEGLIDPDFAATDGKSFQAKVTGSFAGSYIGGSGSDYGNFTNMLMKQNPNYRIVAAPWPVGPAGKGYTSLREVNKHTNGSGMAISTKSKYQKEAAKWLDYQYSDEGCELVNWGLENVTFKKVNGKNQYLDTIMKDPTGITVEQSIAKHCVTPGNGWATIQDPAAKKSTLTVPGQLDIYEVFKTASPDLVMPYITPTPAESTKLANTMNEINTYKEEMVNKFIMGQESLSKFDDFVKNIKGMGIDEALKIQSGALERYNKRK